MTDRFERATFLALLALAFATLAGLLLRVWSKGGVLSGGEGFVVADQLQYLNWLRQSGEHVGIGNAYDLIPSPPAPRPFVHPGLLVSGLLHAAGLGLVLSYAVWKPVAVVALFAAALLLVRRFLPRRDDRRLALVVALFATLPFAPVAELLGASKALQLDFDFLAGELSPVNYLWGYQFTALAVALVPLGLLAYERGRLGWAAACALLCSWLQPWQGATLAGVVVLAEAWRLWRADGPRGPQARTVVAGAALPLAAAAAPLVYYFVLSRTDAAWELAGQANRIERFDAGVLLLGLAPLALPALLTWRLPAPSFGDVALRLWPLVALFVYFQPGGTFPPHALQGLSLPLAVLGVLGLRARVLRDRPIPLVPAVVAVALLVVPGTLHRANELRDAVNKGFQPFFLTAGERDALRHLDDAGEAGGVLAPLYSGQAVPAYAGRETWVGPYSWTPGFERRRALADDLFGGRLSRERAAAVVRESGARFLLTDCQRRADVTALLGDLVEPPRRFGCAAVHRVRTP